MPVKTRLKKGDRVVVLSGKDKGKRGNIVSVDRERGKVIVEGIHLAKKHTRAQGRIRQGGIVDVPQPIPVLRVMRICPRCDKPTPLQRIVKGDDYVFLCKRCEEEFR
ncbi:MAG: 50S ribosomal protein L24 [bacterium JZ-2024 1]